MTGCGIINGLHRVMSSSLIVDSLAGVTGKLLLITCVDLLTGISLIIERQLRLIY